CLRLAERALAGARVSAKDLDRVLLVGGPTQMPIVRAALQSKLNVKLDSSQDPMTVVARGAALYASTQERTGAARAAAIDATKIPGDTGAVQIQLSYERASGTLQSPVAGIVPENSPVDGIRIDAEGG